jgi:prolyl 4-hydroxylase
MIFIVIVKEVIKNVFVIDKFFSEEECDHFIDVSEKIGYQVATVETERGSVILDKVRNNHRILYRNEDLAVNLWKRLSEFAPQKIGNSISVGLNELFRFYKYEAGQKFKKHIDESFIRNDNEASYYTFMVYLNDKFEGGETKFDEISIKSGKGMALIFLHSIPHEGTEVRSGVKYVLRTDIMYTLKAE